jgi:hypothetical protein
MTKPPTDELHTNSNCQKKKAAQHRVHRTSAGAAGTSGDSVPLAVRPLAFFCQFLHFPVTPTIMLPKLHLNWN